MNCKKVKLAVALSACMGLFACGGSSDSPSAPTAATTSVADVLKTNADIAFASYGDSVTTAQALKTALERLIATPTDANLTAAKQAWLDSREPYGQTEVYRFRNGPIDDDKATADAEDGPEGQINAWPLSEGLIDYVANIVDGDSGTLPVIAPAINNNIIEDASLTINEALLTSLFEAGGDESNVTTGYHAIEFLLWGQDLNQDLTGVGTRDATDGRRPVSDYAITVADCTSGVINNNAVTACDRRGQYLVAAVDLLIADLQGVTDQWDESIANNHRADFLAGGDVSLAVILEGMGRLSFGELASERISVALNFDSQEDEHSCFSDNTHRDIFLNAKGVRNSFLGEYTKVDGSVVSGAGIDDLLLSEAKDAAEQTLREALAATEDSAQAVSDSAEVDGVPFDNLIQDSNDTLVLAVVTNLTAQTEAIEDVIVALSLTAGDLRQDASQQL